MIERTAIIKAPPGDVWRALTDPAAMAQWMAEPELRLEILTDWRVGSPIVMKGYHHIQFENRGTVLRFEPTSLLQYSHQSSLSRLPDTPENYSTIEFRLTSAEEDAHATSLTVTIATFPTEAIQKHLDFYWRTAIHAVKRFIESHHEAVSPA